MCIPLPRVTGIRMLVALLLRACSLLLNAAISTRPVQAVQVAAIATAPAGLSANAWQRILVQREQDQPPAPSPATQIAKLTAADAHAFDWFGEAVALDGDTVLVGANQDARDSEPGAAYIFGRHQGGPNAWRQVAKLTATDAQAMDNFGFAVALQGDIAVVGAKSEDGGVGDPLPGAGAVYVYARHQGGENAWGQVAKLTANDAKASDWFGWDVALDDNTALISALRGDSDAT